MPKALILYDRIVEQGNPDQKDTLVQAHAVGQALADSGWEPVEVPFSLDLAGFMKTIQSIKPAFVFNLVESVEGHGRLIYLASALMDLVGVPYTGSKTDSLYTTSNKRIAKKELVNVGIPTPRSFSEAELKAAPFSLQGCFIVKSTWEHASIGLGEDSVVAASDSRQLLRALQQRRAGLGGEGFVEAYIEGREFNLSLLASRDGPEVLPPAEMRFDGYPPGKLKMLDYRAKWEEDSFECRHTRRNFDFSMSDRPLLQRLSELARRCWSLFEIRGYARVDFRVDEKNRPWVLEINANPCLSPDAGFIAAIDRAGIPYCRMVERILEDSGIEKGI
ncbi:MAG: ATP-grasp domain-containing protein [Deltaproteobacteria bacterium]|nr:ATP-grasp domain-containing protein [Deltaproteobacteria bacterium]